MCLRKQSFGEAAVLMDDTTLISRKRYLKGGNNDHEMHRNYSLKSTNVSFRSLFIHPTNALKYLLIYEKFLTFFLSKSLKIKASAE